MKMENGKACDKGAAVIVLNFEDYMKISYTHLKSKQADDKPYYSEVHNIALDQAKNRIKKMSLLMLLKRK